MIYSIFMKEIKTTEMSMLGFDPYEIFEKQGIRLEDPNSHDKQNGFHHEGDENWEELIPDYLKLERV